MSEKTVSKLKRGETGIVKSFTDPVMSLKLLEMGCVPGCEITLDTVAPFGDPVCVNIGGNYCLSLRLNEASTIVIE